MVGELEHAEVRTVLDTQGGEDATEAGCSGGHSSVELRSAGEHGQRREEEAELLQLETGIAEGVRRDVRGLGAHGADAERHRCLSQHRQRRRKNFQAVPALHFRRAILLEDHRERLGAVLRAARREGGSKEATAQRAAGAACCWADEDAGKARLSLANAHLEASEQAQHGDCREVLHLETLDRGHARDVRPKQDHLRRRHGQRVSHRAEPDPVHCEDPLSRR